MADADDASRLLSHVLEALDALYDRWDHAETWLAWHLDATCVALRGTDWEPMLADSVKALVSITRSDWDPDRRNTAALAATDQLRQAIAAL